jgi:uncharacterized Zn-binding protein involved in type VI secretion
MSKQIATVGDTHTCPMVTGTVPHIGGTIISGSPSIFVNNKPVARMGDKCICTGCGMICIIVQGDANVLVDGVPIAYAGCMTSHGGVITSGQPNALITGNKPPNIVTMPLEDIPFPSIYLIDKILSSKNIKESKANIEKIKEQAYNDEENISITSTVAIEQFIEFCKETETEDFINQCQEAYGSKIDKESFKILQEKAKNNQIQQPEIKTTNGYVPKDVHYDFKEGNHVIQVTERIIKASKENESEHDRLMQNLGNAFNDYLKHIIDNECQSTVNS